MGTLAFHCLLATAQGYVVTPRQPSAPHLRQGALATRSAPVAAALDAKGLKAAGLAALASLALVASPVPAYAKGGGHGGGGHSGHGGHHHSPPSFPRSSTSSYLDLHSFSPASSGPSGVFPSASEESTRIYPTYAEAQLNGGFVCPATLPRAGTKVDIVGKLDGPATEELQGEVSLLERKFWDVDTAIRQLSRDAPRKAALQEERDELGRQEKEARARLRDQLSAKQTAVVLDSQPPNNGGCGFQVQYADSTTDTVHVPAVKALTRQEERVEVTVMLAFLAAMGRLWFYSVGRPGPYKAMKDRLNEALGEDVPSTIPNLRSLSGEFQGKSSESDWGNQHVQVTLTLGKDGGVTGLGRDGVDGPYTVTRGRWDVLRNGNLQLKWEESYNEGFVAICEGEYDTRSGTIRGRFASSRSVSGSVRLTKAQ